MGLAIARLFVIGHDACHQAFFADRRTNRFLGRIAFLPSLTNYSLWEAGHNVGHHVYTNLRGRDHVWVPRTKAEYDAMPPWRRALERHYRSGFGYGLYYAVELWWKQLVWPTAEQRARPNGAYRQDTALVAVFAAAWIGVLVACAWATAQSALLLLLLGCVLPFALWNLVMGTVIYFHHTHPQVTWFDDAELWEANRETCSSTVQITFPFGLGALLNHIMQHPSHHLEVRVPLYRLNEAQAVLAAQHSATIVQPFGLRFALDCPRRCKLYDYDAQRWTDFDGAYTSAAVHLPGTAPAEALPETTGALGTA